MPSLEVIELPVEMANELELSTAAGRVSDAETTALRTDTAPSTEDPSAVVMTEASDAPSATLGSVVGATTATATITKPKTTKRKITPLTAGTGKKMKKGQRTMGSFFKKKVTPPAASLSSTKSSENNTGARSVASVESVASHPSTSSLSTARNPQLDTLAGRRKNVLMGIVMGRSSDRSSVTTAAAVVAATETTHSTAAAKAAVAPAAHAADTTSSVVHKAVAAVPPEATVGTTTATTASTTASTTVNRSASTGVSPMVRQVRLFDDDNDVVVVDADADTPIPEHAKASLESSTATNGTACTEKTPASVVVTVLQTRRKRAAVTSTATTATNATTTNSSTTDTDTTTTTSTSHHPPVQELSSRKKSKIRATDTTTTTTTTPKSAPTPASTAVANGNDTVSPTTTKSDDSAAAEVAVAPKLAANPILYQRHVALRATYSRRAHEVLEQCRKGVPEEDFVMSVPTVEAMTVAVAIENDATKAFPECATKTLVALIEGRSESLSALATRATTELTKLYRREFDREAVSAKMKLLATRKHYIKDPTVLRTYSDKTATTSNPSVLPNIFEDVSADYMWRWEVTVLELVPAEYLSRVKKARSARKKLASHFAALVRLLQSLDAADQLAPEAPKLARLLARISQEEEKAVKFDRESEKSRLIAEAKVQKEVAKKQEIQQKLEQTEEKRKEKERKKEELNALKLKKKTETETLKQKKVAEKDEKERKELAKKNTLVNKQKKLMMNFLKAPSQRKDKVRMESNATAGRGDDLAKSALPDFDVDTFRASIRNSVDDNAAATVSNLFKASRRTRKRRTGRVTLPVYVTVYPDNYNAFSAQPYAEQVNVQVQNKYRFLAFHEDVRPAYYGTWSKQSKTIRGNKPFTKDTTFLDYTVDSEGEWEEGDDDIGDVGEELGDDGADADEDKHFDVGGAEEDDGWLAADDDLGVEVDDETKVLHEKKRKEAEQRGAMTVCIIAPHNGRPLCRTISPECSDRKIDGFKPPEAFDLLENLRVTRLTNFEHRLDAFPNVSTETACTSAKTNSETASYVKGGQEMTEEQMKLFALFVHNNTLGSKDKVVDEFFSAHPKVSLKRSKVVRVLDSIAEKKKHPRNGTFWEVKKCVLEKLSLEHLTKTAGADDAKQEIMKTIARFVHNSTTASKEKIVDDLRIEHDSVTNSRAEALRILQLLSEKKKHPQGGYYWEIKTEVQEELGLTDLPASPPLKPGCSLTASVSSNFAQRSVPKSDALGNVSFVAKPTNKAAAETATGSSKKRKGSKTATAGSVKLLAAFIKKAS